MAWRAEDEALLERLEDEALLARLFEHHVGAIAARNDGARPHARAAGLVSAARKEPGGDAAVARARTGDIVALVRFLETAPLRERRAELLHHLALHHALVARTLESFTPESAANAWMRSLAAWLALGEERAYLLSLTDAILGNDKKDTARIPPERVPLEVRHRLLHAIAIDLVVDGLRLATRDLVHRHLRDLAPAGRAALLALAWIDEAVRIAGIGDEGKKAAHREAERRRNAAVEAALSAVEESFEDAKARGVLAKEGRSVLVRALEVWAWSAHDEAVEHFCVDRLGTVGWELYRARDWDALRFLLDPFRGLIDHLATRIERDPSKIAYAAACAEMYVFLSDVDRLLQQKVEYAERAVRVCPTHRNGRLTLASLLCDEAMTIMRGSMSVIARKTHLDRVEALIARAEKLYPQTGELPEAKAMLDKVKRGAISIG